MKKNLKKLISIALCSAMLISTASIAGSAAEAPKCNCGHCPVVVLPGINHSPTYLYDENDQPVLDSDGNQIGGTLLILDTESLLKKCLVKVILSVLATAATQHSVGLQKTAYEAACVAFNIQQCDNDGNHVKNLKTKRWYHPLSEMTEDDLAWFYRMIPMQKLVDDIGADHVYLYTFNLVGDPMNSADELNDYIQMVKQQTGHDKVQLLAVSLGGTILTSYLDAYGHDDIESITGAVACLDGTDIVADLMERKFNLTDEYLYHEYIPSILKSETGNATLGYVINIALRILPRSGVNALLSGAVSGMLDTIMINCPQIWAMLPSYRYDNLAAKYLNDPEKAILKQKTDRFQQARLNLKENILAAKQDGVRVNLISGANLNFGDQMYAFFAIVDSTGKVNTDGIINLSSTTLGATGAANGETLPDGYTQAYTNPDYPDYSYISPDNKVDASTAVLPDNTWIFLDQHHEVGNNDVVLTVTKAIIMDEVSDVHDQPDVYPQFNFSCNTKALRRWRLNDLKGIDQTDLSQEEKDRINNAIAEDEAVLGMTIADSDRADKALAETNEILYEYGVLERPEDTSEKDAKTEAAFEKISLFLLKHLGGGSLFDRIFR